MNRATIFSEYIDRIIVDESGNIPRYIAVSRNKKHIQLSTFAYSLLKKVATGNSFSAIAQEIGLEREQHVTPEEIEQAYGVVIEKIRKIDSGPSTRQRDFWLKISLVPAAAVQHLASTMTFLFHPLLSFGLLSSLVLLVARALEQGWLSAVLRLDFHTLLPAYLLFLVSLLAHELGHSSAGAKGGIKPSEIGVAIYLVFPVFYSDVSASWELGRWHKVRVDVGGIYFQLCIGAVYLLLLLVTHLPIFQLAFALILGSCLLSLNPFLKFDGYWILSDILGIPNLYKQPAYLFTHFYQVLVCKQRRSLRWTPAICIVILVYTFLKAAFWTYLLIFFCRAMWQSILMYPTLLTQTMEHLQHGEHTLLLTDLQRLATSGLFVCVWIGGLGRFCIPPLIRFIGRKRQARAGTPEHSFAK